MMSELERGTDGAAARVRAWLVRRLGGITSRDSARLLTEQGAAYREQMEAFTRDADTINIRSDYITLHGMRFSGNVTVNGGKINLIGCLIDGDLSLPPGAEVKLSETFVRGSARDDQAPLPDPPE